MWSMFNTGILTKTLFKVRTLFVVTISVGLLYVILYLSYVTNSPLQVFTESSLNRSFKVYHRIVKTINEEKNEIPKTLSISGTKVNAPLNDIFNITKKIAAIKEFFHFDKSLNTTDYDIALKEKRLSKSKTLLTLFTTCKVNNESYSIFYNTLQNWSSFKPTFNLVLFTNDTDLENDAQRYGWKVLPLLKVAKNGLPILKYMYIDAITKFWSTFYCYANSDMLFEDGLEKTLTNLEGKLGFDLLESKPVFLTGLRWNVVKVLPKEIFPRENIKTLIKKRGKLFTTAAEDYFITNGIYPWRNIPEVVVGSVAYDNWLVFNARKQKHLTIDTSITVPALHQSVDNNNFRSHMRDTAKYNFLLLNRVSFKISYHKGFIRCIERFTEFVNDTVVVIRNRKVKSKCKLSRLH